MIHVIADITVKAGKRDELIALFHQLVPTVLAEEGCISDGPTVDIETDIGVQEECQPNRVTIMEQWDSVAALEQHLGMPHMAEFRSNLAGIVEGLQLRVCKPV